MNFSRTVLIFLILALLTGGISFSGFLAGSSLLILFQILFPIFALLFIISVIRSIFFPGPKQ
jgi:uncharacterized membrane protein YtjA (UPF0391 family)